LLVSIYTPGTYDQLLIDPIDVFTIAVAYSADHFNARALHCSGAALIGAIGFLVSGLLPATAYSVGIPVT
jgi:hypothetical protein